MEIDFKEKTGKSYQEWAALLSASGFDKHKQLVDYLKSKHQLTHGFANAIVLKYRKVDPAVQADKDLLKKQYKGKESLLPVYDKLNQLLLSLGDDVTVSFKNTSVSYIRKHQFALIKPATKTRIDLGLKLKGVEPEGILEDSGPFGTMCTHRIQIQSASAVNDEVKQWLSKAYEMSV